MDGGAESVPSRDQRQGPVALGDGLRRAALRGRGRGTAEMFRRRLQPSQDSCLLDSPHRIRGEEYGHDDPPDVVAISAKRSKPAPPIRPTMLATDQPAGATQDEPKQGKQDLPAVERVDRQQVEHQDDQVDYGYRRQKSFGGRKAAASEPGDTNRQSPM